MLYTNSTQNRRSYGTILFIVMQKTIDEAATEIFLIGFYGISVEIYHESTIVSCIKCHDPVADIVLRAPYNGRTV